MRHMCKGVARIINRNIISPQEYIDSWGGGAMRAVVPAHSSVPRIGGTYKHAPSAGH